MEKKNANLNADFKADIGYRFSKTDIFKILKDALSGDREALNRPEVVGINLSAIKSALDWLQKSGGLDNTTRNLLSNESWRLAYKRKPITPQEFLTPEFIGDQANTLWAPVKNAFLEFLDPVAPYRNLVLSVSIGWGKQQPLYSKVYLHNKVPYCDITLYNGEKIYEKLEGSIKIKGETFSVKNIISNKTKLKVKKAKIKYDYDYKLIKDIKIGDYILSPSFKSVKVEGIIDWDPMAIYKIILDNGRSYCCGLPHICHVSKDKKTYINKELKDIIKDNPSSYYMKGLDFKNSRIKEIKYIGLENSRCISIADDTGLYVTDGKIITHNSLLADLVLAYIMTEFCNMLAPYRVLGHSVMTKYIIALGCNTLSRASALILEPLEALMEASPFFEKIKYAEDLKKVEEEDPNFTKMYYSTASRSSDISLRNGLNIKRMNDPFALIGLSQPLDSKIYLPDGSFKLMKDIKVGDIIASPTEGKQEVLGVFPQGKTECYEIEFEDGRKTKCSPKHKWKVAYKKDENGKWIWENHTLQFIIDHTELEFEFWDKDCNDDLDYVWQPGIKDLNIKNSKLKSIKKIEDCEQQCIYVSSKDHAYITDDHIVTLNTIIAGTLTELAWFRDAGWSDEKILKFFTDLQERIASRMSGNYMGRLIIDSSPYSLESPIDNWVWHKAPKSIENYIITGSRWKHYPEEFSEYIVNGKQKNEYGPAFQMFLGSEKEPPKVIEDALSASKYDPIDLIWCPSKQITIKGTKSFISLAKENPKTFLRNFAGIPSGAPDRVFNDINIIEEIFDNNLINIYDSITADASENPELLIWNKVKDIFFNEINGRYFFYREPSAIRAISVDQSESGDATAIAISHLEYKVENGEVYNVLVVDATIVIIPNNGRINLDAIKYFIRDLIVLGNMKIIEASFDSYESSSTKQFLLREGVNAKYISVDKTNEPYLRLIDYSTHGRVKCGKNIHAKNNFKSIQMVKRKRTGSVKFDHTEGPIVHVSDNMDWDTCLIGIHAKDVTDAIAASLELIARNESLYVPSCEWKDTSSYEESVIQLINKRGFYIN